MERANLRSRLLIAALAASAIAAGIGAYRSAPHASAASGGTITGQVVWCAPVPYYLGAPGTAEADAVPVPPTSSAVDPTSKPASPPSIMPRPVPIPRLIPAGAVLVALQGTSLGTRTGEDGRFVIEGVPTGQYLTLAVGPVAKMNGAVAQRPNVFVTDGQKSDVGQISLSQPCSYYGPVPYAIPASDSVAPDGVE
ncbi:MAG: hypothetical protein EPO65_12375 [Dehalococcoidia bacterium]|nr:MAG: hypothetical protein EPO65_12375 [Dehalococcoidia bacterium]